MVRSAHLTLSPIRLTAQFDFAVSDIIPFDLDLFITINVRNEFLMSELY